VVSSESEPRRLIGLHFGVQMLVTLWPDGSAEIATRLNGSETWSAPSPLEETE